MRKLHFYGWPNFPVIWSSWNVQDVFIAPIHRRLLFALLLFPNCNTNADDTMHSAHFKRSGTNNVTCKREQRNWFFFLFFWDYCRRWRRRYVRYSYIHSAVHARDSLTTTPFELIVNLLLFERVKLKERRVNKWSYKSFKRVHSIPTDVATIPFLIYSGLSNPVQLFSSVALNVLLLMMRIFFIVVVVAQQNDNETKKKITLKNNTIVHSYLVLYLLTQPLTEIEFVFFF